MLRAAFALAAAAVACSALAADAAVRPRLLIASIDPVVVAGSGFRAGERVRLVVSGDVVAKRLVIANVRGRFVARFAVRGGPCKAVLVQALGSRGVRASVRMDAPTCAPIDP